MPTVAVLGGGLSGLCSAHLLARSGAHKVVLLEKSARFGGWIETLRDRDNGVVFETGPRSVRPVGLPGIVTLQLVDQLGLTHSLVTIPKSHPAAQKRYIFHRGRLHAAPSSLFSAVKGALDPNSPFYGLLGRIAKEPFIKAPSPALEDETVDSFVSRRLGGPLVDNVLSALVHGIYAGDTRQLSIKAIFPSLWKLEQKHGSIVRGQLAKLRAKPSTDDISKEEIATTIPELAASMKDVSVYTFREGLEALPKALIASLQKQSNVELRNDISVQTLRHDGAATGGKILVETPGETIKADHVVSAISSSALGQFVDLPHLSSNPSVTVGVVNFAFAPGTKLPVRGFGYLIPRSATAQENPHKVLGVIFDSEILDNGVEESPLRLTVMMGGHHWNGTTPPSKQEALQGALATLRQHGLISKDVEPIDSHVQIQADCIPQYGLGHLQRLTELHEQLDMRFSGRLGVVGASYSGVGINDCVLSSWQHAQTFEKHGRATGLERYIKAVMGPPLPGFPAAHREGR